MNHARILTSVPRHPKFLRAGPAASWLWLAGVCYCQDALTDGFISTEALPMLGVTKPLPLAAKLVQVGLWHAEEGGWRIHDYLQHNNTAEYIQRIRQERKAAGAKGGRGNRAAMKLVNQLAPDLLWQVVEQTVNPTVNGTTITGTPINGTEEKQERADAPSLRSETTNERVNRLNQAMRQHRRRRSRETDDGRPATRVIAALARDVLREHPDETDDLELRTLLKEACAKVNLAYDSAVVGDALDRAKAQARRTS